MPVKLQVSNADDDTELGEYLFEQAPVTIGRASKNDLTLPDQKRIVSGEHAEIRREGETHQLVDLGSKNFTYLNGERLRSGHPYPVQSGDVFKVGDFEIAFTTIAAATPSVPSGDATVFAADFSNPFDAPAAKLADALGEIIAAYEQEAPNRREDALWTALDQALSGEEAGHEAVARAFAALGTENSTASAATSGMKGEASAEAPPPNSPPPLNAPQAHASLPHHAQDNTAPAENAAAGEDFDGEVFTEGGPGSTYGASAYPPSATGAQEGALFGLLLESVARLIRIPWQFRHEFIGQTIVQSSDDAALYEGDPEALAEHLLGPRLSEEEAGRRRERLEEAVDRLVVHQMAMLDGYRASAQTGARQLLDQLDPAAEVQALAEENTLYALLPVFGRSAAVDRLQTVHQELQSENWSVAERRIFRPAFVKAYLARMTAAPAGNE